MLAIAFGWKLLGAGLAALVVAGLAGLWSFDRPERRRVRTAAGVLAVLALITILVTIVVGPGAWCSAGDAYRVPGCG